MAFNSNNFSFGQVIGVLGTGVGFPGNISRGGAKRTVRARPVLPTTATNLPFGAGAIEISNTTGGYFQSFADFLATASNAQFLQQQFSGIAVRNVKTDLQYVSLQQPTNTVVTTTMTGTSGANTITVASATGIVVGQLVEGFNIGLDAVVTGVSGTTITLSLNNLGTINAGTAVAFISPNTAGQVGSYAKGTEGEVLLEGSITIVIGNGTPQNNLAVYVRTVANATLPGTFVGGFEAADDTATTALTVGTTLGSTTMTTSAGTGLAVGQRIISIYFPANTYIVSGSGTSWVVSQAAIATVASGGVMSSSNTALLGSASDPWIRFSTGQIDNNNVAEVTILTRRSA